MPAAVAIGTLRLRGAAADTPALRLRAARELAGADLSPPGLAPAAVLVLRRLVDPLPRRLAAGGARVRPDPAWERAVRERLAAAARTAARPDGRGVLPPDGGAVLFADAAELLACAVRERVRGRLAERWWWRAVERRLPVAVALGPGSDPAPLLAARPGAAPAALARLVRWGEAAAVAAVLSPGGASRVLAALAAEHGLAREVVGAVGGVGEGGPGPGGGGKAGGGAGEPAAAAAVRTAGAWPPEPWRFWLPPELREGPLPPPVRCLFGVALGLAASPQRVRAPALARQARRWWRAVAAAGGGPIGTRRPVTAAAKPPAVKEEATPEAGADDREQAAPVIGESVARRLRFGVEPPAAEAAAKAAAPAPSLPATAAPASVAASATALLGAVGSDVRRGAADSAPAVEATAAERAATGGLPAAPAEAPEPGGRERPSAAVRASEEPGAGARTPTGIAEAAPPAPGRWWDFVEGAPTRIGGVLYLLHLLADLGLPESFERGWRLASVAGPWGTLELVGRGLLGGRFPRDPLWRALGELAGWPDESAGRRLSPPSYRVPAIWPGKLADPGDGFAWSAARGRLRLWSAAGYLLAEVPRDGGPPSRQARRELTRLGLGGADARDGTPPSSAVAGSAPSPLRRARATAAPLAAVPLPPGRPPLLGRWMSAALPAVRRRLLLGLVGGGPALARAQEAVPGSRRDPVALALAVAGRLYVTSSHVDLVLPLAAADLTVRRAGLDRDPGWLPAGGRVVSFHFD